MATWYHSNQWTPLGYSGLATSTTETISWKNSTGSTVKINSITLKLGIGKSGYAVKIGSSSNVAPTQQLFEISNGNWYWNTAPQAYRYDDMTQAYVSGTHEQGYTTTPVLGASNYTTPSMTSYTGTANAFTVSATCNSISTDTQSVSNQMARSAQYVFGMYKSGSTKSWDNVYVQYECTDEDYDSVYDIYRAKYEWDGETYPKWNPGYFKSPTGTYTLTFTSQITVSSGSSVSFAITFTAANGQTIVIRNGKNITVNYDVVTPVDYGPYYPWVNANNSGTWVTPGSSITDGIYGAMVKTGDSFVPWYAAGDPIIKDYDNNWLKYEKSVEFPGAYAQMLTITSSTFYWFYRTATGKFWVDFSVSSPLSADEGYMLLETRNASNAATRFTIRLGCYVDDTKSTGDGDFYIYLKNSSSGTGSGELDTPKEMYVGHRYRAEIALSGGTDSTAGTATLTVTDVDTGDTWTQSGSMNTADNTGYKMDLFASYIITGNNHRAFKGTCYGFGFEDGLTTTGHGVHNFDFDLSSVGYDYLKQSDYNSSGVFTSSIKLKLNNSLTVNGSWVEIDEEEAEE